uniref:Alanyl-tRNA editing protein Aarsd1 n=1 Tax=Cacopsylla melanoneura TaxID=428564 RepID=A0A8D8RUC2_9HEMI
MKAHFNVCFIVFSIKIAVIEMVFLCQKDSFLKEHQTKVVSCRQNGSDPKQYHVRLEDTIFFPLGGGQHSDKGTLGGAEVVDVFRDGEEAVHVMNKEFQPGQVVDLKIDWPHRFDQMQQHTGQHLLSAVIDKMFNYSTESWNCGADVCDVELDTRTKDLTEDDVSAIEGECNRLIQQGVKVYASVYEPDDPMLKTAHTRGLPKDHKGAIRIVHIDGLDNNMCCGTHVTNLNQLQIMKLLKTSRAQKGHYLLHFVVGNRVLKKLKETYNREREMSALIKCNPENQLELVRKNIELSRKQHKYLSNVLKDMAVLEARSVNKDSPYTFIYRREGDMSYATSFMREFQKQQLQSDALLVIVVGDGQEGNLLVFNKSGKAEEIGKLLCDANILDGVGRGRDNQFMAKLKHPERHVKANDAVKKHLKS